MVVGRKLFNGTSPLNPILWESIIQNIFDAPGVIWGKGGGGSCLIRMCILVMYPCGVSLCLVHVVYRV